jgi:hypothetical protein
MFFTAKTTLSTTFAINPQFRESYKLYLRSCSQIECIKKRAKKFGWLSKTTEWAFIQTMA